MPKVSVIIPVLNCENYIAQSIESILNQTFSDFELIILDDCSTDRTIEICKRYTNSDSRVRLILNEINLGYALNRNKGIKESTGKYIVWQDADDVALSDRIELQYNLLESSSEIGMVGGWMEILSDNKIIGIRKYPMHDCDIRKMIFRFSPIALPAAMIRKEVFRVINCYSEEMGPAADLDMTFKIGESWKLANVPQPIVQYRVHVHSGTIKNLRNIEINSIKLRWRNRTSEYYSPTFSDYCFNVLHFVSIFMVPAKLKLWLFGLIRDTE